MTDTDPGATDTDCVPPRTEAIASELEAGRRLLHCLDCGGQVLALRHGGSCLRCGSLAVVVEVL